MLFETYLLALKAGRVVFFLQSSFFINFSAVSLFRKAYIRFIFKSLKLPYSGIYLNHSRIRRLCGIAPILFPMYGLSRKYSGRVAYIRYSHIPEKNPCFSTQGGRRKLH